MNRKTMARLREVRSVLEDAREKLSRIHNGAHHADDTEAMMRFTWDSYEAVVKAISNLPKRNRKTAAKTSTP